MTHEELMQLVAAGEQAIAANAAAFAASSYGRARAREAEAEAIAKRTGLSVGKARAWLIAGVKITE